MVNTRYVVKQADAETIQYATADMKGIETGTSPYYSGNYVAMSRKVQYWVVLLGTVKSMRKLKNVADG
jgi:hypothetical protein